MLFRSPGEIFVGEGPGGMVQVSEDDLLIYKSAQKGRAEAEREARRLLDEQLVRIGRSVRTGHPEFDAPIRSRAANPAELARRVAAPETRSAIDALLRFSAPFAADLAVRDGRLTWECYGTTRTTGDGWKRLVAELTRLAGRLDG